MMFLIMFLCVYYHLQLVAPIPLVFTDSYDLCTFKIADKDVQIPDKLWTIFTKDFNLYFSLCKSKQRACLNQTSSCLIYKKTHQQINFGVDFSPGDDDFTFVARSFTECPTDSSKNYTFSLSFQCSDSIKTKPRILALEDECTLEVIMMKPGCTPKCTTIVDNAYFLDFRLLRKPITFDNFSLSLCGSNPSCPRGISACNITTNPKTPLATLESQHFIYDVATNRLTSRGRFKIRSREFREMQVLLKCKWDTDLSNPIYKKVRIQGKKYRFEVESSFGCVKLPQHCTVSSMNNLHYNLKGLYRNEGWEVSGVPNGKIALNMCGPLNKLKGLCADQYSQVCHVNQGSYTNRGSILSSLHASDDVIHATFVSGSTCAQNSSLSYTTEITFKCSSTEKGPFFTDSKQCVTFLTWETPNACPVEIFEGENCYVNDRFSNRNLKEIHSKTDKIYPLTVDHKTRLVYNLCGPTREKCAGFGNVSFCLKSGGDDVIIGWENHRLISDTGRLRMELQGAVCATGNQAQVGVSFVCSYAVPSPPAQIQVLEDSCKFNVTIFTSLACFSQEQFNDCMYSTANLTYDLSPLIRKNDNYIIPHQNEEFALNLCGPIVSENGALCRGNTMVCWRNKTELNVRHRYKSLGGIGRPTLENGSLIVEANFGTFCDEVSYYKTVIHFTCSPQRILPQFLRKNNCVYEFIWKTPEACPRPTECCVPGSSPGMTLNLTSLQQKTFLINLEEKTQYKFDLCTDSYTKVLKGVSSSFPLHRQYFTDSKNMYLLLDLQNPCSGSSSIRKVFFKIECLSGSNDVFQQTSFEQCVLNITIGTQSGCSMIQNHTPAVEAYIQKKKNSTVYSVEPEKVVREVPKFRLNCTLVNADTGFEFDLNEIKTEEILFNTTKYNINFNGQSTSCRGILCKNGTKLITDECPTPSFDHSQQRIVLGYSSQRLCSKNDFYKVEIELRCGDIHRGGSILRDQTCKTDISYEFPEACYLLKRPESVKTAVIAGSVTCLLLVIVFAVLVYLNRHRCNNYPRHIPFIRDKTAVPIYVRNSTL